MMVRADNTKTTADYARAEGFGTTASGSAAHAEGQAGVANSQASHAEGMSSNAFATAAHAEGNLTAAYGLNAHSEGDNCSAIGNSSHAQGVYAGPRILGQDAIGAGSFTGTPGDAQATTLALRALSTGAAGVTLTSNGAAAAPDATAPSSPNVLLIPVSRAHTFTISVVARRSDVSGDVAGWVFTGLVSRGSTGDAVIAGNVHVQTWFTGAAAGAWDVTLTIDNTSATNNYVKITATGEAAKTIRWVARIHTSEVG